MDKKRRDFLKIAGVSTLAGLGGTAVVDQLVSGTSPVQSRAAKEVDTEHGAAHAPAAHENAHGHGAGRQEVNEEKDFARRCFRNIP